MAVILAGLYLIFQTVTYAALIAVMPRAGGDYVDERRVLGGGIGFVLAVTGWWFILWHWVPSTPTSEQGGLRAAVRDREPRREPSPSSAAPPGSSPRWSSLCWPRPSRSGCAYARIQKFCFYGLVGLAIMIVLLLLSSNADFVSAFNREAQILFGAGGNAYQQTVQAGEAAGGLQVGSALGPTLLLIPF